MPAVPDPDSRAALARAEWRQSAGLTGYMDAIQFMESRVQAIAAGQAPECVWLVEHPPLYTAGTSAMPEDLLDATRLPVFNTGRGGQFTYHGPGQRVAYVMLDLKKRAAPQQPDLRAYVKQLEQWLIASLARVRITAFTREGRVGVWVQDPHRGEAKIAALGIRIRKWVSYHGVAINIAPDLSHYSAIVPCGIKNYGVTSMAALGVNLPLAEFDAILSQEFAQLFG